MFSRHPHIQEPKHVTKEVRAAALDVAGRCRACRQWVTPHEECFGTWQLARGYGGKRPEGRGERLCHWQRVQVVTETAGW